MLITLIVFGPDKLPDVAKKLGKFMGMLKRNSEAVRREFYNAVYEPAADIQREIDNANRRLTALSNDLIPSEELTCEDSELKKEIDEFGLEKVLEDKKAEVMQKHASERDAPIDSRPTTYNQVSDQAGSTQDTSSEPTTESESKEDT